VTEHKQNENEILESSAEQTPAIAELNPSEKTVSDTKDSAVADPHANREADKYDNPIPSREYIVELLEKSRNRCASNR